MRWERRKCAVVLASLLMLQGQAISSSAATQQEVEKQAQIPPSQDDKQTSVGKPENQPAAADKKDDQVSNHKWHVRLGTVTVGAAYTHFPDGFLFDPFFPYGYYPYGLAYSSFFYDPLYPPFYGPYGPALAYGADKGKVELAAEPKSAEVYLDGAYAGLAGRLKSMWLRPGAYDLTVSVPDGAAFHQRIYVLSGKSLKIKAKLVPQSVEGKAQEKTEKQP